MLLKEFVRRRPSEVSTGGRVFILFWLCPPTKTASRFTQDFEKDPEDSSPCQLPYSGS